jgi:carbamoylphosphate synthase small subunit
MLTGFETITHELTEQEMKFVPAIVAHLSLRKGKVNAITNQALSEYLKVRSIGSVAGARMRKLINYIRHKHLVPALIATSAGYYIAETPAEIEAYITSLDGRANEIIRIADVMRIDSIRMREFFDKHRDKIA